MKFLEFKIFQCNNPETKEPKLESAMRIIHEWKGSDQEVKDLMDKYEKGELVRTPVESKLPEKEEKPHSHGDL